MRRLLPLLLLWATHSLAEQPVLRFSVAESWSMPLMRVEGDKPVEGLLFDLMQAIAREAGVRPEYHVLARLRLQEAMESGDIDVRCYVSPQWFHDRPGNYVWSIPLIHQRDVLVGGAGEVSPTRPEQLAPQAIGTVLGYAYSTLQPLFEQGRLHREDSRSQLLALQKLHAGRYLHAVSNELSLQWFNHSLPAGQQLQVLAVLEEQELGCMVRSDPAVPTQGVLRALVRIKQTGEIERISQRYGAAGYAGNAAAPRP
ncbi:Bacterial extracellular solute-binding protein, family 3 [compost metagenome]|uniref:Transporter substrate-binding domain-containing protein n=1 Tax=Pseudomonas capeferrum TaxID=1495066 RepID=A0ABY7R4S5_9PSED|nr:MULTISPECIES: transporter substrate-binding domain-containing protein [Pseudomonas]KGI95141.1 amino acid ABC transporter substrate-binding protein [Pseudomonas sp. H2]MDD2063628.1 ABC transporter substrate-binding protein [Pseudomonas sp. 25571]MUT53450.1 transporter substrate-binding domain-containing protein [Pseudomonas sp. TDA1]UDU79780.1 ABC transporter substrate-binding protein [Pseudomonas sp. HN2-3]UPL07563.1 Bacterial extracellular solute-binding proteins, family 3 [Pseudomonas sp.